MGIVLKLIGLLIPMLVQWAEKTIVGQGQGPKKRQAVLDVVHMVLGILNPLLPAEALAFEKDAEDFLDFLIDKALDALHVPGDADSAPVSSLEAHAAQKALDVPPVIPGWSVDKVHHG